jgi:guanylate kinase
MNEMHNQLKGKVVIISGPSGVGKSTLCDEIVKRMDNAYLSVSATTRAQAEGEIDGEDYVFLTPEEFQRRIDQGLFLEYAKVFDHYYGTPKDKIEEAVASGKTVILEIDVQGAKKAKLIFPNAIMIFILPPSAKVLEDRMNHRGRDDTQSAQQRLGGASTEIAAAWQYYEHMVINENLDQAVEEVIQIINNEGRDSS